MSFSDPINATCPVFINGDESLGLLFFLGRPRFLFIVAVGEALLVVSDVVPLKGLRGTITLSIES